MDCYVWLKRLTLDRGSSFDISATIFPNIVSGQRMVALRLLEGPILVLSFANGKSAGVPSVFETQNGKEIFGMFAALSFDEANTFRVIRLVSDDAHDSHPCRRQRWPHFLHEPNAWRAGRIYLGIGRQYPNDPCHHI